MPPYIIPPYIKKGDRIALVSPATKVRHEYVEGACRWFEAHGFCPEVFPHADSEPSGSFAGPLEGRVSDLRSAITDKGIKAIFCCRGGYGCQQLLPFLSVEEIAENPKWIIGFSDISALHALWRKAGVVSLHAPMAKHLTLHPDDFCSETLLKIIMGKYRVENRGEYTFAPHPLNIEGRGKGILVGGNMAVLNGLAATPYDILGPEGEDIVLFIEDVGENIYEIDRILSRLAMAGTFRRVKALLCGRFTEYGPDLNYKDMEEMISRRLSLLGVDIPMAFDVPVGHVDENYPFPSGVETEVEISSDRVKMYF